MECGNKPVHEQRFDAAVKVIQSLPPNGTFQPSNEMMLKFYSYYKQATNGPCSIPRPGFWDPVGKVKWDAWHALGDMPKDEAMAAYVENLKLILESMPMSDQVEELLQVIGPFYELVDERKVTHVSDLTAGFGSMVTAHSKAVAKDIIRTMQMNGTLDGHLMKNGKKQIEEQDDGGDDDDESGDDEGDTEEVQHMEKAPKRRVSSPGKAERFPNGSTGQNAAPSPGGAHGSKAALNGKDWEEKDDGLTLNGAVQHMGGHTGAENLKDDVEDLVIPPHMASDSDSEVYCDSVDQFGVDEGYEVQVVHSLSESPSPLSSLEETQPTGLESEGLLGVQEAMGHGGEDVKDGSGGAQRQGLDVGRSGSTVVRRGRGSRSPGLGPGTTGLLQGAGGDGGRWGTNGDVGGDLNQQIIMALARLQEDMQSVLERLHTLEALTASQARAAGLPSEYLQAPAKPPQKKHSWWPFDVTPTTAILAVVWPFIAQWLIRLYFQRRRRQTH